MPVIDTRIDRDSDEFQQNSAANVALAENLKEVVEHILTGGSARARERHLVRASCCQGIASMG